MREEHYTSQLSAFVNHELEKSTQREIAEHLMVCAACRAEHDHIRFGAAIAGKLEGRDAPPSLWTSIEASLDNGKRSPFGLMPDRSFFDIRGFAGLAAAGLIVTAFVSLAYLMLFTRDHEQVTATDPTISQPQPIRPMTPDNAVASPSNSQQSHEIANTNTAPFTLPDANGVQTVPATATAGFEFDTISGKPLVGSASTAGSLSVGDYLETDSNSRARIKVADIGNVEIRPNSRVRLVGTDPKQHRLSLERGSLHARILAPPRLFIVDTPTAVAVDLGCEYTLDVDKAGNSKLHVTSGFVALERGGRESIVPAGAMCLTRKGKGLGTPFSADTSEDFRRALERFDFANGGSRAVDDVLANKTFYDIISLWHLLTRVSKPDRERIFEALAAYVAPPDDVTKDGVLALDKKMLESWRSEVERAWFE